MKGDVDTEQSLTATAVINRSGANIHGNERDGQMEVKQRENEADAITSVLIVTQISWVYDLNSQRILKISNSSEKHHLCHVKAIVSRENKFNKND